MNILLSIALVLMQSSCSNKPSGTAVMNEPTVETGKSFHNFTMESLEGEQIPMSNYKGKVLVVINVASKCGHTPQYKDIEAFYKMYKDKGVEVLGFPANNFLSQEPGSNEDIAAFCEKNYGVTFQMFSKVSVKGNDMDSLYHFLTEKSENGKLDAPVKWNFQKFIIDKEGNVVTFFAPGFEVTELDFLKVIDELIK